MDYKNRKILVTGGGGFLGRYICKNLIDQGFKVISFSRKSYRNLEALGVECFIGNICSPEKLLQASASCEAIIHTAAKAGVWGNKREYESINIEGTKNVIFAAKKHNIPLVYTSSPSVVFSNKDIRGKDESLAYADKSYCYYASSKIKAEQYVLEAAKNKSINAVSLRPHLIWGPDDPHFLPRLIYKSKKKKLFKIGTGKNLVDVIFVENAAYAHVLALKKLLHSSKISGRTYFLGQESPVNLWDFVDKLLKACHQSTNKKTISFPIAYTMGYFCEFFYRNIPWLTKKEPPITRFLSLQLAKSHYFNHSRIQKDIGYTPQVSTLQGLEKILFWYNKNSSVHESLV